MLLAETSHTRVKPPTRPLTPALTALSISKATTAAETQAMYMRGFINPRTTRELRGGGTGEEGVQGPACQAVLSRTMETLLLPICVCPAATCMLSTLPAHTYHLGAAAPENPRQVLHEEKMHPRV